MNINSLLRNSITKNFFSLSSIQFFNVILPFITIPYLTRTLGLEYFGIVSYAQVFITYFISLADYGFITTATRDIALHKNNIAKVSSIFSSVLTMKLLFAMLGFILFVIMIFSFERLNKHWEVYLLSYVFVIGQTMLPIWFFQGIEKMKYLSLLNLCGKIIFTILIFFCC